MPWRFSKKRSGTAEMHGAAAFNGLPLLKLATRQQLNVEDADGRTPGLVAAERGNLDALKIIHKRGGNLGKPDLMGNTALHLAAKNGHLACVTYLMEKECCNPYYQDNDDVTALEAARELKMDEMVTCIQGLLERAEGAKGVKWVEKMKREAAVCGHVRKIRFNEKQKKREKKLMREMKSEQLQQPMRTKSMTDLLDSSTGSNQSVVLHASHSATNFSEILMRKRNHVKTSWLVLLVQLKQPIEKKKKKDLFERSHSVENFRSQNKLSDASTSSISTNSNALVKGRPVIGHDLASALSRLQPDSISRSEEDFFSSIESEPQGENINILMEDPFSYCEEPNFCEPDDKEKLRFFLECYGVGDIFPELIQQGCTYEQFESADISSLESFKIHSSARETLKKAVKIRQNFRNSVEPGPMIDIFL